VLCVTDLIHTNTYDLLTPTAMYHVKIHELCSCVRFHVKWSLLVQNQNWSNDICEISH
jgi:hypothetical protein